jgi:protein-S-isoprenylcysteine O-methyltransferase Ste14
MLLNYSGQARTAVPFPPPLNFFAFLAAGCLLEFIVPSRPGTWPWMSCITAGFILFILSAVLAASAFSALIKNKTTFNPSKPTTMIVREGTFRFSRNPMYLALLLLLGGTALILCSLWLFLSLLMLFFVLDVFVVRREEEYLTAKFGNEYLDYKAAVRRWL